MDDNRYCIIQSKTQEQSQSREELEKLLEETIETIRKLNEEELNESDACL